MLFFDKPEKVHSQAVNYKAYALFLYNFMKYVEWPETEGDFVIGIAGESPIKETSTN